MTEEIRIVDSEGKLQFDWKCTHPLNSNQSCCPLAVSIEKGQEVVIGKDCICIGRRGNSEALVPCEWLGNLTYESALWMQLAKNGWNIAVDSLEEEWNQFFDVIKAANKMRRMYDI